MDGEGTGGYSGGKMRRAVRPASKPARKPVRKPVHKPVMADKKRVFRKKLLKHFGGFFSQLEDLAKTMETTSGPTTGKPKHSSMPPMPPRDAGSSQAGGRPRGKKVVRRRGGPRVGGSAEEEFTGLDDMYKMGDSFIKPVMGPLVTGLESGAKSAGVGGARYGVRRPARRAASPARRPRRPASYRSASPARRR